MRIDCKMLIIFLSLATLGCSNEAYKKKLIRTNRNNTVKNPYGAYMELDSRVSQHQGEFISYSSDTIYIMTINQLEKIYKDDIVRFQIILTQNKSKRYLATTGLLLIPSLLGAAISTDYSDEFLVIGLSTLILGGTATLIESSRKPNIVNYPTDFSDIKLFSKYARFPAGFPDYFDPNSLE